MAPPSSTAATPAPQAKVDAPTCTIKDAPPSLESMPPVIWEEMLKFLSPHDMCKISHRISKSLGAGEDKVESIEKAAKHILADLMKRAFHVKYLYRPFNRGKIFRGDQNAIENFVDDEALPKLEGESYFRTYYLAHEMLPACLHVFYQKWDDSKPAIENSTLCHSWIVMWLLYGAPGLPPLNDVQTSAAAAAVDALTDILGPKFRNDRHDDQESDRAATKAKLDSYCRGRILRMATRINSIGLFGRAAYCFNILTYNRPHPLDTGYDAEFYIGCRVVLQGLSKEELNGRPGIVVKNYDAKHSRMGVRLNPASDEKASRLIGIKPQNLRPESEDSDFVIDAKIMATMVSCEMTESITTDYLPPVSKDIHLLRKLSQSLRARIDESNEPIKATFVQDGESSLFHYDRLRLVIVELSLCRLLIHRAYHTALDGTLIDHGEVLCNGYQKIVEEAPRSERIRGVIAAESFFGEATELLLKIDEIADEYDNIELIDGELHCGLDGQAIFPEGHIMSELAPLRNFCVANLHHFAAVVSKEIGIVLLSFGEEDEETALRFHAVRAAAIYRTWIEDNLKDAANSHPSRVLTVQSVCYDDGEGTMPHSYARNLIRLSCGLGARINHNIILGISLPETEKEDGPFFLGFSLAILIRTLGTGHKLTKTFGGFLEGVEGWECDPLNDPESLEAVINPWLARRFQQRDE